MSFAAPAIAAVITVIAFLAGIKLGTAVQNALTEAERQSKEIYFRAHTALANKLAAVKAEVDKIEAEEHNNAVVGRALDVVNRLKPFFLVGGGSGGGGEEGH